MREDKVNKITDDVQMPVRIRSRTEKKLHVCGISRTIADAPEGRSTDVKSVIFQRVFCMGTSRSLTKPRYTCIFNRAGVLRFHTVHHPNE